MHDRKQAPSRPAPRDLATCHMWFRDILPWPLAGSGSDAAQLRRELRAWQNHVRELHFQFDADMARANTTFRAAYGALNEEARRLDKALDESRALSRVLLHEERERVAALEEALKRADEQLAARSVAGSFAIGEPAPDEIVIAADDVAEAVRGVARALKAASEALTGSKKESNEFWALAIGRDMLRECVAARRRLAPCVVLGLRLLRMQAAAVAGGRGVRSGAVRQVLLRQLCDPVILLLRKAKGRAASLQRLGGATAAAACSIRFRSGPPHGAGRSQPHSCRACAVAGVLAALPGLGGRRPAARRRRREQRAQPAGRQVRHLPRAQPCHARASRAHPVRQRSRSRSQ